jgi:hypothetical protein
MKNDNRALLQYPLRVAANGHSSKDTRFKIWVLCLATLLIAPYSYHQCQLIEAFAHKRDVQNGIEILISHQTDNKYSKLKRMMETL